MTTLIRSLCLTTAVFASAALADDPTALKHKKDVTAVSLSSDGKFIASGSDEGNVIVWDGAAQVAERVSDQGAVKAVAVSPDGKTVAVGSMYGDVTLWERESGKDKFTKRGHEGRITQAVFFADGKRFATSSIDHSVRVWDLTGAEKAKLMGHKYDVNGVAVSRDGAKAWSCDSNGDVIVWNVAKAKQAGTYAPSKGNARALTLSADGKVLAVGYEDGAVVFVDPEKGKELRRGKVSDAVNSLAFSPDGKVLAVGTQGEDLFTLDAATGAAGKTLKGHERPVTSVAFSGDGKRLVSGSMDMSVRVWPQ